MKNKIAVFCQDREDFYSLHLHPRNKFIRVESIDDLFDVNVVGVVCTYMFYAEDSVCKAYKYLELTKPKLFK